MTNGPKLNRPQLLNGFNTLKLASAPSIPAVGTVNIYMKTDNTLYWQDSNGTETAFSGGGGGGSSNTGSAVINTATSTEIITTPSENIITTFVNAENVSAGRIRILYDGSDIKSIEEGVSGFYVGNSSSNVQVITEDAGYSLDNLSLISSKNGNVSPQTTTPQTGIFSSNGLKLFTASNTNTIYEYNLSEAYNPSTLVFNQSKNMSPSVTACRGFRFNNDGTRMILCQFGSGTILEFELSTAYDISTLNTTPIHSSSVSTANGTPLGLCFSSDGSRFYWCSSGGRVRSYNCPTPYSINGMTETNVFNFSTQVSIIAGIEISSDGSRLFLLSFENSEIYFYTLGSAYNITTSSFYGSLDLSTDAPSPTELIFYNNGQNILIPNEGNDEIAVFSSSDAFNGTCYVSAFY